MSALNFKQQMFTLQIIENILSSCGNIMANSSLDTVWQKQHAYLQFN